MEIGGVKLRSQKSKVDDLRDQITALNDRITTCDVSKVKNEKDREKFHKLVKLSEEELESLKGELNELEQDIKNASCNAEQVRKKAEDAEYVFTLIDFF
jgi:structural maintenance of chromosome 4